jgi:hypothetical protein
MPLLKLNGRALGGRLLLVLGGGLKSAGFAKGGSGGWGGITGHRGLRVEGTRGFRC